MSKRGRVLGSKNNYTRKLSGFKRFFTHCKYEAVRMKRGKMGRDGRRRDFEFTFQEFFILVRQSCYLCGALPTERTISNEGGRRYKIVCNGLDRVDNTKGYVAGNTKSCCFPCNVWKSDLLLSTCLERVRKIAARHPATLIEQPEEPKEDPTNYV